VLLGVVVAEAEGDEEAIELEEGESEMVGVTYAKGDGIDINADMSTGDFEFDNEGVVDVAFIGVLDLERYGVNEADV